MRILLVTPASERQQRLAERFVAAGYECASATDVATALQLGSRQAFELVLCDHALPTDAALALAPLIVADPRQPTAIVSGIRFEDDHTPLAARSLAAHFRSLAETLEGDSRQSRKLAYLGLELDPAALRGTRDGIELGLTQTEYRLLECLVRHAGTAVSRRVLCKEVWSPDWHGLTNVVDVYVSRVRRKVDRNFEVPLVHTVRGVGYRLGRRS